MIGEARAWRPEVPGVVEVLHADLRDHAYPAHTHDAWTLLLIDAGAVRYDLDRAAHLTGAGMLTILPPHVAHDGRPVQPGGSYRKRVLYLDAHWLPPSAIGAAVHRPAIEGTDAATAARAFHHAVTRPGDELVAECAVIALRERVFAHLAGERTTPARDDPLARRLRELLDGRLTESFTLAEAGRLLGAHPAHLARAFSRAYGIAPHRYVTARRVDLARRAILAGAALAEAAVDAGFHDQAHLTRHFRRVLGVTPAAFAGRTRVRGLPLDSARRTGWGQR